MIKVKVYPQFPARVTGSGLVTLEKANGVWTAGFDVSELGDTVILNPEDIRFLAYNRLTGEYSLAPLASVIAASTAVRTITASGDVAVTNFDTFIRLNKTALEGTNLNLPPAANRNGLELTVKDVKGNASGYNFNLYPSGSETIDGLSPYTGSMNFQVIRLKPRTGGWDVMHSG